MIHNLLVAIDHDDAAPQLVAAVRTLLGGAAVDVTVLHVRERQPRGVALYSRTDAERLVDRTVSELRRAGIRARGRVHACLPFCIPPAILDVAADEGAEAIVIGTYRRSGLTRWLEGSVSRGVIGKSRVPVFTVPLGEWPPTRTQNSEHPHRGSFNVVAPNFSGGQHRFDGRT